MITRLDGLATTALLLLGASLTGFAVGQQLSPASTADNKCASWLWNSTEFTARSNQTIECNVWTTDDASTSLFFCKDESTTSVANGCMCGRGIDCDNNNYCNFDNASDETKNAIGTCAVRNQDDDDDDVSVVSGEVEQQEPLSGEVIAVLSFSAVFSVVMVVACSVLCSSSAGAGGTSSAEVNRDHWFQCCCDTCNLGVNVGDCCCCCECGDSGGCEGCADCGGCDVCCDCCCFCPS